MKINTITLEGKKSGNINLSDSIFKIKPNIAVVRQVVLAELTNMRQGTHSSKNRSKVNGGGKKPWKQKMGKCVSSRTRFPDVFFFFKNKTIGDPFSNEQNLLTLTVKPKLTIYTHGQTKTYHLNLRSKTTTTTKHKSRILGSSS